MYQFNFLHKKQPQVLDRGSTAGSGGGYIRSTPRQINKIQKATKKAKLKSLAENTFLALHYGYGPLRGQIAYGAVENGTTLALLYLFCIGEIEGFEKIYVGNIDINDPKKGLIAKGGSVNAYLGTQDQEPDPIFSSLIEGYGDSLPGVAYLVVRIPESYKSVPTCTAIVKGKKVYNPKNGQVEYSTTPALWLGDFITQGNDSYGLGALVDWASVEAVQDANDETMSNGEPRRGGGFVTVGAPQRSEDVVGLLAKMAGCFVTQEDFVYRLIPDRPSDVVASFDMTNMVLERLVKKRAVDCPTAVEVQWTDLSKYPAETQSVWESRPEVKNGEMPWIPASFDLTGITSASQAKREAIETLNKYINDLSIQFLGFDEALKLQAGDVIEVSHDVGLNKKKFRLVQDPILVEPGRWRIVAEEYDPAIYSNTVITESTYPDTDLPDPLHAPQVENLVLSESLGRKPDGTVYCRINATWDEVQWPYIEGYEIKITSGDEIVFVGKVGKRPATFSSPPVEEKRLYVVSVRAYNSLVHDADWASESITPVGRWWKPADVVSFHGYEAGGVVHLWWEHPDDIDIKEFELRYYPVDGDWDHGLVLNRLNALRYQTDDLPEGTWKIGIKAVDSLDQMSENVNEITIEVTTDADAFKLASKELELNTSATDFDVYTVPITNDNKAVVGWQTKCLTKGDTAFGQVFSSALGSYDRPLAYYCDNGGDSKLETLERDYGKDYSGNFILQRDIEVLRGGAQEEHLLRKDGESTPSSTDFMSVKAKARYEAYRVKTSGRGNVVCVRLPIRSHLSVVPRTEYSYSPVTSSSDGPTTIQLQGTYSSVMGISIAIIGQEAASWNYNNINLAAGTFDIYIFDKDGQLVSRQFTWKFLGV